MDGDWGFGCVENERVGNKGLWKERKIGVFWERGNVRLIFDSTREVRERRLSRSSGLIWDLWSDLVLSQCLGQSQHPLKNFLRLIVLRIFPSIFPWCLTGKMRSLIRRGI